MRYIRNFKKAVLICMHGASKQFDKNLLNEQEVMNNLSEMMMEAYVAESVALRVARLEELKGHAAAAVFRDILDVYVYDAADMIRKDAIDAIHSFALPEYSGNLVVAAEALTRVAGVNIKEARRRIAAKLIEDNAYKF